MRKAIKAGREGKVANAPYSASTGRFTPTEDDYCIACSGSGYYDDNGSPPCGSCNGTGLKNNG